MRVLLGITGGIAAYKSVEILRALQESGCDVEVAMTRSARRFVAPRTFSALTGRPVHTSLWHEHQDRSPEAPIEHIALAQNIDAMLIAPATANTIARLAHGFADDLLSTAALATPAPLVLAPAMNVVMWQHPATQANVQTLVERGATVVEPEAGYLACGMTGSGRLAAVDRIVSATLAVRRSRDLADEVVLITAGGTREAIDPVRYLGNRSSGRMGHALAAAAQARGASVHLVTASPLPVPPGVEAVRVENAEGMWQELERRLPQATVVIAAAAVADFRPVQYSPQKIRRAGLLTLELEPTPDLVARVVAQRRPETTVIAFAAETENLEANGRNKLLRKGADAIIANDVSKPGYGFDAEDNAGLFLTAEDTLELPPGPKRRFADSILDAVHKILVQRKRTHDECSRTTLDDLVVTPA